MKIAILGFGLEGRACYKYYNSPENEITICDQSKIKDPPENVNVINGTDYLLGLDKYDLIIRSPGVRPIDIVHANSPKILEKVTTSTNEFFAKSPTINIIGVTGTKGKGTTSSLIYKMLVAAGHSVHLAGNIGVPAIELLSAGLKSGDWVVLELSSFQLADLKYSPHIGVVLMLNSEHLDWHELMDEYLRAKKSIFVNQKPNDIAIYFGENKFSAEVAAVTPGIKIPYYRSPGAIISNDNFIIDDQLICSTNDVKLMGRHNWQNVAAAITAFWQVDQKPEVAAQVIKTFEGLSHRLELVRVVNDVKYYNDSFASVPDATIAAIDAVEGRKILIIGGFDRGLNLDPLASAISRNHLIGGVVVIGASSKRVADALTKAGFTKFISNPSTTMTEIVHQARDLAMPGDAVLLSPGFPSFDMFKNFEDRGVQFKEAVKNL